MGFINDAEESDFEPETDRLLDPFAAVDEETAAATTPNGKAFSPLLKTPTSRNNDLLSVTRARRKGMLTETEEILEELEDDAVGELSPFSHRRVSSVRSTPSRGVRMDGEEGAPRPPLPPATASESTALLERRGTGRSYRDVGRGGRRRRRRSAALSVGEGSRWQQQGRQRWWEREWWRGREKKRRGGGEDEERGGGGTE